MSAFTHDELVTLSKFSYDVLNLVNDEARRYHQGNVTFGWFHTRCQQVAKDLKGRDQAPILNREPLDERLKELELSGNPFAAILRRKK